MAGAERADVEKKAVRHTTTVRGESAKRDERPKPVIFIRDFNPDEVTTTSYAEYALRVLGFRPAKSSTPTATLVRRVRRGVGVNYATALAERIGVEPKKVYSIIGVSERTAARKKAEKKPLDSEQSDVLARIARIVGLAEDVLESQEAAHRWLNKPNRVLGAIPLSLLDTDIGTEQVEEVLLRIQYGIYS